jgi:multiple sugar transport system permease protein/sn-glycerol 3-phosphate transport system permease protein
MSVTPQIMPFWRTRRGQDRLVSAAIFAALSAGGAVIMLPFFWMLSTALKRAEEVYLSPPVWIPNPPQWENFYTALTRVPFHLYAWNTAVIVALVMIGTLLSCSFAAYGFARLKAPGKDLIFLLVLATLMLPGAVTLVPTYLLFNRIGWVGTILPLVVPAFFGSAFNIFLLRQFYMSIPAELEEAAKIDGASVYRIWWSIMLPLSQPVLATVAVFTFVGTYNDFFTPLIYLSDEEQRTIAVALSYFSGSPRIGPQMHLMMAAVTVSILPPLLLFLAAQRYFVRGIVMSGIKG